MTTPAIVEARDLHKTFVLSRDNRVEALRGASLRVLAGEMLALTGPSGSGKSTLLHVLGMLDHVDAGQIVIDGHDVTRARGREAARLRASRLGFVFQQFNLLPDLTALENVALPGEYAGMRRRDAHARARELLGRVGLADRVAHRPVELSGGQQQRVALARALMNRPALVLADEPTGDLDSATSRDVMAMVRDLCSETGQTFVIVTHDATVASACDRVATMLDGRVSDDGAAGGA